MTKATISFDKFLEIQGQLEIRVGEVTEAIRIPKKDKLLQLTVSFGDNLGVKTVVTNLGQYFEPENFVSRKLPFIVNLEPAKLGGVLSEAMIIVGKPDVGDLEVLSIELGAMSDYSNGSQLI